MSKRTKPINVQFTHRLRILLGEPGETQGKLADAIGVKRQSIGQWKDGTTVPDIVSLGKIADYYKVTTDYLLGRENQTIKKYYIHRTHENPENNMTIQCNNRNEMYDYATECLRQGYTVKTEIKED